MELQVQAQHLSLSDSPDGSDELYQSHIAAIFAQHDLARLEKEAQQVRSSKARLKDGVWKLFVFYEGVTKPSGSNADDSEWNARITAVKEWVAAYPDSATARIALAASYVNYGWAARGNGLVALLDAARVKEKCPYCFEVMQQVALAQGWEKPQARELFERATTFEPSYYHFYREYASFLLSKWYGQVGDTQAFAEEMAKKLGETNGSILYFEAASLFACQCHDEGIPSAACLGQE